MPSALPAAEEKRVHNPPAHLTRIIGCADSIDRLTPRLQLRDRDRIGEARDLLAPIYERFTEGFRTADLQAAKRLLGELG